MASYTDFNRRSGLGVDGGTIQQQGGGDKVASHCDTSNEGGANDTGRWLPVTISELFGAGGAGASFQGLHFGPQGLQGGLHLVEDVG